MGGWIEKTIESLGYVGVALLTFAENLFPPLPSEVIMPLAGFAASRGEMEVGVAIVAGALGSLAGTTVYYVAGRSVSDEAMRRYIRSYGKYASLEEADLDRATRWFERHGRWALLLCRFVPGLRTVISLPAGLARTSTRSYLFYSAAGIVVWTAGLTYAGALLGRDYQQVGRYLGPVAWWVLGILLTALAVYLYRRRDAW